MSAHIFTQIRRSSHLSNSKNKIPKKHRTRPTHWPVRLAAAFTSAALIITLPLPEIGTAATEPINAESPRYWSACETLTVEIVPSDTNPAYYTEVVKAAQDLSQRTGVPIRIRLTLEEPTLEWVGDQSAKEPNSPNIMRVSVQEPGGALTPGLNGEARVLTDGNEIVRATVIFNQTTLEWMQGGPGIPNPGSRLRLLVMHELGHAFGLRHSPSNLDVMSTPAINYRGPADTWGPGDLKALEGTRTATTQCDTTQ